MGKYSGDAKFTESQALIAAMMGDDEELERLVQGMYRNERRELIDACRMVITTAEMFNRGSNRR